MRFRLSARRLRHDGKGDWPLWLMFAFLAACLLLGGSSRFDSQSMLVLRPMAVVVLAVFACLPRTAGAAALRPLAWMLAAFALLIAVQLVPLPRVLWGIMPARAALADRLQAAGVAMSWITISTTPDRTWSSLLDLLVPAAILTGYGALTHHQRRLLLNAAVATAVASALLGILQISFPRSGWLYIHRPTTEGLPVGFFANRNHQALYLATAVPMLWVLLSRAPRRKPSRLRLFALTGIAAVLALVTVLTGSRAGLVFLIVAGLSALSLLRLNLGFASPRRVRMVALAAAIGLPVIVVGIAALAGRATSLYRLIVPYNATSDLRFSFTGIVWRMVRDFLPLGSGFGSFESLFMMYEPDWALKLTYFNNAHNDLLEFALSGGVPAVLLLAVLVGWVSVRARAGFGGGADGAADPCSRLGAIVIGTILLASLVDYPLRTAIVGAEFTLMLCWLADRWSAARAGG